MASRFVERTVLASVWVAGRCHCEAGLAVSIVRRLHARARNVRSALDATAPSPTRARNRLVSPCVCQNAELKEDQHNHKKELATRIERQGLSGDRVLKVRAITNKLNNPPSAKKSAPSLSSHLTAAAGAGRRATRARARARAPPAPAHCAAHGNLPGSRLRAHPPKPHLASPAPRPPTCFNHPNPTQTIRKPPKNPNTTAREPRTATGNPNCRSRGNRSRAERNDDDDQRGRRSRPRRTSSTSSASSSRRSRSSSTCSRSCRSSSLSASTKRPAPTTSRSERRR